MQVQELQGSVLQGVQQANLTGTVVSGVGNRLHLQQQPPHLRPADAEERVMLYVRQESEDVYTPLHVTPPTVQGLLNAVRYAKDYSIEHTTGNDTFNWTHAAVHSSPDIPCETVSIRVLGRRLAVIQISDWTSRWSIYQLNNLLGGYCILNAFLSRLAPFKLFYLKRYVVESN